MDRPLTARQQQVYDFIHEKISVRGYGPTVREIAEFLGIRSPNGVMCHLRALERKGMINRIANKSRAIELVNGIMREKISSLAVHGQVEHGECNLFDSPKSFDVLGLLEHPDRYLLKYSGHELRDWAIADGDILIVEHCADGGGGSLALIRTPDGVIALRPCEADAPTADSRFDNRNDSLPISGMSAEPNCSSPTAVRGILDGTPVNNDLSRGRLDNFAVVQRTTSVVHTSAIQSQAAEVIGVVVGVLRAQQNSREPFDRQPHLHGIRRQVKT